MDVRNMFCGQCYKKILATATQKLYEWKEIREDCVDHESYFLGSLKEREIERRHDVDCFIFILKANWNFRIIRLDIDLG